MSNLIQIIEQKLSNTLSHAIIKIIDESALHDDHFADPNQSISHLQILVQSSSFDNKTPLQRHRIVYDVLSDEIKQVHAMSFSLKDSSNN